MQKRTALPLVGFLFLLSLLVRPLQAAGFPELTELVEEASPAVVNISTMTAPKRGQSPLYGPNMEQIPEIFRDFFGPHLQIPGNAQPRQSLGSGFIISDDGYILTNNHVVEGADEIMVRLSDRRELEAKLIGADPRSDMALLKVEASNLPTARLGSSDALKAGQWVVAIGSPFGFDHSVTAGIVSAINRSLPNGGENYVPFIQTDVAINPGNSGGPLFDLDGRVVGINSQIYTRSGGFMGLSFAIPIDVALEVAEQLKEQGYVSRGWLGVLVQEIDRDLAESFGLEKAVGALVSQVVADSPAEQAGLKAGDVILRFADKPIRVSGDLPHIVGRLRPGQSVEARILRRGKQQTVSVNIGELPGEEGAPVAASPASNRLGIQVRDLSRDQKAELALDYGVQVVEVQEGTARLIGLRRGDIISDINNQPIDSAKAFYRAVKELPEKRSVAMRVIRKGRPYYISFRLPN